MTYRPDRNGVQALLNSPEMAELVTSAAENIAGNVRAQKPDADVVVDKYKAVAKGRFTEREAASVTVRDVRARIWQARDGLLTRAATAEGLEVTERGG